MAQEALSCFKALLGNVPAWIADVESILKFAAEKQEEILFANQPQDLVQPARTEKSAPGSSSQTLSASETGERDAVHRTAPSALPDQPRTMSDALRLSQRKRKTASVCSGSRSGPSEFRARPAMVVYYDNETQQRFEYLVRSIGSARNALRKVRMTVKVDSLSRAASSDSKTSNGSTGQENNLDVTYLQYKSTRWTRTTSLHSGEGSEMLEQVDACLEKAQEQCERAAHQALRYGDCKLGVSGVKQHLTEALRLVETELPNIQKEADRAAERRRRSEQRQRAEAEAEAEAEAGGQTKLALERSEKIHLVTKPGSNDVDLEADEFEVDDLDCDDCNFTIGDIPSALKNLSAMRGARLTAH